MANKESETTGSYPKSFEKGFPAYKKSDEITALEKKMGALSNSGSKADADKIIQANNEYDIALKKDKSKYETNKVIALKEAYKKVAIAEKKWEAVKKKYPNGKLENGVYTVGGNNMNAIKFYKPDLNYNDLKAEGDALFEFEINGGGGKQQWSSQGYDEKYGDNQLNAFFDKVDKVKSSYDSKAAEKAKNFNDLQKNMPGGKLIGEVYTVEGNDFVSDGTLKAKNGNKGTWEDYGKKYMINIGGDRYDHPNALEGLNKANEKYKTRRTEEIKNEKEDAAFDAITGVKGSGAAARKKTEGAGGRSNFLEASKPTNVTENISNVSPTNINGKKEEDDRFAGYRDVSSSYNSSIGGEATTDGSVGLFGDGGGTYSSTNGAQNQAKRDLENLSATTGVPFSALANMDKDKVEALKAKVAEIDAVKLKTDEVKNRETPSSSSSSSSNYSGGSTRGNTSNNNPINIQDLSEEITGTDETTTGVVKKTESREDIERRIQDNKDLLNNLGNRPKFVHDYAPDQQKNTNLVDNITDAGRIAMGGIAANTKIPIYERGSMFQTSMDELSDRRNIGLSDTEKDFARNMAERGYGYDVKNIGKFAGGSAGVALGNLGRATGQLYDEYGKIAVRDEGVRRQNRSDFNRGALADEQVNRQIFTDDLNQKMMTKQAGAALIQDTTKNMRDRAQYEKAYGKGSQMYEYMKTLDRDKQASMFDQEAANDRRVEDSIKTSERAIEDDEKLLQGLGGLTQGTTLGGEAGAMEGLKTVAELEDAYAKGDIDDFTYQSKLQQQPEGTTMPDNYEFPSAANPTGNSNPQTVRNVTNDPTVRNDYREGLVGNFKKSESGIVNNIENKTTPIPDLATPGIVDEAVVKESVADEVVPEVVTPDEVVVDGEVPLGENGGVDNYGEPWATDNKDVSGEVAQEETVIPTAKETYENLKDELREQLDSGEITNEEFYKKYDERLIERRDKIKKSQEFNPNKFSDTEGKVSREDQTPEDKMADYEKELSGSPEILAKYKKDPIAFLEEDIRGWENQPDSEKKTQSIKNLEENLDILRNDFEMERNEDNIKDYETELGQNAETLKRYKENPIAFLEDDIKGWESEPDSEEKTKSLENLKKNLKYLKSLKKK